VHCDADGHVTELRGAPVRGLTPAALTVPEVGSNVTPAPLPKFDPTPTAVHCDPDGQATPEKSPPLETCLTPAAFIAPEAGLNVTSVPLSSTAVHCDADGHATDLRGGDPV